MRRTKYCCTPLFFAPLHRWALQHNVAWPLNNGLSNCLDHDDVESLWRQLLNESGDALLGYHAGRCFLPTSWPKINERILRSETYHEAYQVLVSVQSSLAQPAFLRLEETSDRITLCIEWHGFSPHVTRHLTDYTLRCLALLSSWLRQPHQWVSEIELAHPEPPCEPGQGYRFLRQALGPHGQLRSGTGRTAVIISRQVYETPFRDSIQAAADPVRTEGGDGMRQITQAIEQGLRHERLSLKQVAATLNVSERTLHRRLSALGTSYNELVLKVRLHNAQRLLRETRASMFDIALDVGFRDPASFTRFFKREAGMTPTRFRELQDTQPPASSLAPQHELET